MKITVKEYDLKLNHKIAVVADLHQNDPQQVLTMLKELKPELILVPGDLFERYMPYDRVNVAKSFIEEKEMKYNPVYFYVKMALLHENHNKENPRIFLREASKIAPIIFSLGNHERFLYQEDLDAIAESNTLFLNNSEAVWNGIRIGGLSSKADLDWLEEFSKKDGYKILMNHHPEYYEKYIKSKCDNFDLILSGHAHGGQWRFFNQGIFAPGQGLFPKYVVGKHATEGGWMIISAGLANTIKVPRLFNDREIVVLK